MAITGLPDAVFVQHEPTGRPQPMAGRSTRWDRPGVEVVLDHDADGGLAVALGSTTTVARIALRWHLELPERSSIYGDVWERSYGELQWRGLEPHRILAWYWLAHDRDAARTVGMGVDVNPLSLCSWTLDRTGATLWLDVRCGSDPLELQGGTVTAAVVRTFSHDGSAWDAAKQACREMSAGIQSRRAERDRGPVAGSNNWYYAYGEGFDQQAVLTDAQTVVELSDGHPNRPYCVIDDGWNEGGAAFGGPWNQGKAGVFDDLRDTVAQIRDVGARPGVWYRPLLTSVPGPGRRNSHHGTGFLLDPASDAGLEQIRTDAEWFGAQGFELIKHDFSNFDVFGRWGPQMGFDLTGPDLHFDDRGRTTAMVLQEVYRTIAAAFSGGVIIGCNTMGHLAAGHVDLQRTGDDTSGRSWERTRRMGVNTLAHRSPQHGSFFVADADCVPSTPATPWSSNRQFLDAVSRSGTSLFVSVDPRTRNDTVDADLSAALVRALDGGTPGGLEPLDWLDSTAPTRWRDAEGEHHYDWSEPFGTWPGSPG